MADRISNQAFDLMTTAVDKTEVDLFPSKVDRSTKGIHTALLAAGMTPGLGNIADVADATLFALEGEFGEAAWSMAAAIPVIGQMVSGKRVLKAAKEAGEEIVTLYRGVDKWHPRRVKTGTGFIVETGDAMVKEGKFVGGGKYLGSRYGKKGYTKVKNKDLWVTTRKEYATGEDFRRAPKKGQILLKFEVPKSIYEKQFFRTGVHEGHAIGFYKGGIPKGFLNEVTKF